MIHTHTHTHIQVAYGMVYMANVGDSRALLAHVTGVFCVVFLYMADAYEYMYTFAHKNTHKLLLGGL